MKTMKNGSRKARSSSTRAMKDLAARKGRSVTGGARSDIGQKLQLQLNEANSIYSR